MLLIGIPGACCLAYGSVGLALIWPDQGPPTHMWTSAGLVLSGAVLVLAGIGRWREPRYLIVFTPVPYLVCAAYLLREAGSALAPTINARILAWPALMFVVLRGFENTARIKSRV